MAGVPHSLSRPLERMEGDLYRLCARPGQHWYPSLCAPTFPLPLDCLAGGPDIFVRLLWLCVPESLGLVWGPSLEW